jgi:tetratricopeptide (TPR) repeat protein
MRRVLTTDPAAFDRRFDAYVRERFARPLAALAADAPEFPAGMTPDELARQADARRESYRTQMLAGTALARAGRRDDAVPYFERAHALFPEYGGDESPAVALWKLHLERGDSARARAALAVVTLADESAYDANIDLAALSLAARDTLAAMAALERAVFINPFPAAVHQTLATLAEARNDAAVRIREREALVALDPVDRAEALYQLALAYRDAGRTDQARRTVLRALEDAPNFVRAQELLLAIVDGKGT